MNKSTVPVLRNQLFEILELARLSPSVHNTQAWLVEFVDQGLKVSVDRRYTLGDGDPTGRQAIIGIGIFCEAIVLVALEKGLEAKLSTFKDDSLTINFQSAKAQRFTDKTIDYLLKHRATDRSIYKPVAISNQAIRYIQSASKDLQAEIHVISDINQIKEIANLTSHGIGLAISSPDFRNELGRFLVVPWSKNKRGIAVKSLYIPLFVAIFEPLLMRLGIGLPLEVKLERRRWLSASAVIAITAEGDLTRYWIDVGRAYLRVSLIIEDLGLCQATSGAIVEASNYHEDVEAMIGTNQRILSMIRIGKGSNHRQYSPRVDLDEIVTLS